LFIEKDNENNIIYTSTKIYSCLSYWMVWTYISSA